MRNSVSEIMVGELRTPKATRLEKRLTALTDGEIEIELTPCFNVHDGVEDRDSKGHLYMGYLTQPEMSDQEDVVWLDDRQPDMPGQLAKELRRVGRMYMNLARKVESHA